MPVPTPLACSLPQVDLAAVTRGVAGPAGVRHVARLVGAAVAEFGFLRVTGHGVPRTVLDGAYAAAAALAAADPERKAALASPTGHPFRGWLEQRDASGTQLVQRFQACTVGSAAEAEALGIDERWYGYFHPNVWPHGSTGLDGFEAAFRDYATATRRLGDTLMQLFASALDLPAGQFAVDPGRDVSCFAANHYPGLVAAGAIVFPEHTDSGTLTLLHQRGGAAGLEVVLHSGERVLVPIEEDVFVVNIGELMARWTNGRWRATRHRVVAAGEPGPTRTSLVTFHLPNVDTVVEPLAALVEPGTEPAYEPVTIHDWEGAFLAGLYERNAGGAVTTTHQANPSMSTELVTPIDLEPYRLGSDADRRATAAAVDAANRGTGFLAVTGHGVEPGVIDRMRVVTGAFFDLPTEEKLRYVVADKAANRGYIALGTEALAYSFGEETPPDLVEGFNIGWEIPDDVAEADDRVRPARSTFFARNVWPERPDGFRAVWLEYWQAMDTLGHLLMDVFASALGLAADHFEPFISKNISVLRANHYDRRSLEPPEPGQLRLGAHSDYGSCSVLLADAVPGLQLLVADAWHDVLPPAEGLLVNIGDLLAEWTNDRWHSTVHRVVAPGPAQDGPARRSSIAFFQQPDWDAVIDVLPACTSPDNPPRYRPTTSGDHLLAKLMGPKRLRPSEVGAEYQRRAATATA